MAAPLSLHAWRSKCNTHSWRESFALYTFFLTFGYDLHTVAEDNFTVRQEKCILPAELTSPWLQLKTEIAVTARGKREPQVPSSAAGARRAPASPVDGSSLRCGRSEVPSAGREPAPSPGRAEADWSGAAVGQRLPEGTAAPAPLRGPRLGTPRPRPPCLWVWPLLARQGAKIAPASAPKPALRGAGRAGRKAGNSLLPKISSTAVRSSLLPGLAWHIYAACHSTGPSGGNAYVANRPF